MADIALYDLDSLPLLVFSNGQESIDLLTDSTGQVQTDIRVQTSLNSQYTNSQTKLVSVGIRLDNQSTPITLVSEDYFATNARLYYDSLQELDAYSALAGIIPQAARYQDKKYVTAKILDRASDLSNIQVNSLQAALGSLIATPEADALHPYLDSIRQFYAQSTNPQLTNAATAVITYAVKQAVKYNDVAALDKLVVALTVQGEMLQQAPTAAQAMNTAVQSYDDYQTWINILSLPAVGWIGGTPPVPALDTNCPEGLGIWFNAGTTLAVPLIPCRLTGAMAGDIVNGFMQHIDMQVEPELLTHSLADMYYELGYASIAFRKIILDPEYQTVVYNDTGFLIKDAYAALPLATRIGRMFVKAGKEGIKNFKALMSGNTNLRVNRFVLLGAIAYLMKRTDEQFACAGEQANSCKPLTADGASGQITGNIAKIMGNAILRGKFNDQTKYPKEDLACKVSGDTHGAVFELLMTAYYHASSEGSLGNANPKHEILAIEKKNKINIAEGRKTNKTKHFKDFDRITDIVIKGDGTGDADEDGTFIELKSYQGSKAQGKRKNPLSGASTVKSKFKQVDTDTDKSTLHLQFILDRLSMREIKVADSNNNIDNQKFSKDFVWYFQVWKHKGRDYTRMLDPGTPITRSKCKDVKCFDEIKSKLTIMPDYDKDVLEYNWGVTAANRSLENAKFKSNIKEFNPAVELGKLFTDLPPEFKELQDEIDKAEEIINNLEEQEQKLLEEMERAAKEADRNLQRIPGYNSLKRKYERLARQTEEIVERVTEDVGEKASELLDQIPDPDALLSRCDP